MLLFKTNNAIIKTNNAIIQNESRYYSKSQTCEFLTIELKH